MSARANSNTNDYKEVAWSTFLRVTHCNACKGSTHWQWSWVFQSKQLQLQLQLQLQGNCSRVERKLIALFLWVIHVLKNLSTCSNSYLYHYKKNATSTCLRVNPKPIAIPSHAYLQLAWKKKKIVEGGKKKVVSM